MIAATRRQVRRKRREAGDKVIESLESDLLTLRAPRPSLRVRVALRTCTLGRITVPLISIGWAFFASTWCDALIHEIATGDMRDTYSNFTNEPRRDWESVRGSHFNDAIGSLVPPTILAIAIALFFTIFLLAPPFFAFETIMGLRWSLSRTTRMRRRYDVANCAARAISACAKAHATNWRNRPRTLLHLAEALRPVEAAIMRLRRTSGHLPARSHRNHQLRLHAGLVVAALRSAEARIDSEADAALIELAHLLVKISERATDGRIGALLDPENIDENLTPARDWEPFRLATAAILVAASGVGVGLLNLPEGADTYVIGGCGVAILTLLYGRRAHQFIDILSKIRGG